MKFNDVLVQRTGDGGWVIVTFRGAEGGSVVVRLPHSGGVSESREMLLASTRAALLDAASATDQGNPLPLVDVEVDSSGRVVREPGATQSLEEEDDNPYQRPDEALPENEEESTLRRNPSREGGRFDES